MVHRNARLTPAGRRILVERIEVEGWPVAVAAESMGCRERRRTGGFGAGAAKGLLGWRIARRGREGPRTGRRRRWGIGSARCGSSAVGVHIPIAYALGMHRSTVERVLRRRGLSRLDAIDPPTRRVVRRYERNNPGELVHISM